MKLKDHPEMFNKWPPGLFGLGYDRGDKDPSLSQTDKVIVIGAKIIKDIFYLDVECDRKKITSIIPFESSDFKEKLVQFINTNKGKTLNQVFNMDIDF